jgi:hypothetical protein
VLTNEKYIYIPIWHNAGWYDIFNEGNRYFQYLQYHGASGARGNQKLTIAAAGHGGLQGDIEYPQQKDLRAPNDEMRWWDYWLKGIDTGIMDEPPVTYFMMASGRKGHPSDLSRAIKAAGWPTRQPRNPLLPGAAVHALDESSGHCRREAKLPRRSRTSGEERRRSQSDVSGWLHGSASHRKTSRLSAL